MGFKTENRKAVLRARSALRPYAKQPYRSVFAAATGGTDHYSIAVVKDDGTEEDLSVASILRETIRPYLPADELALDAESVSILKDEDAGIVLSTLYEQAAPKPSAKPSTSTAQSNAHQHTHRDAYDWEAWGTDDKDEKTDEIGTEQDNLYSF